MKTAIQVKTDRQLKIEAENIFHQLGISTSAAVNIFFKAVTEHNGIPFELKLRRPNKQTVAVLKDINAKENIKTFSTVDSFMKDLNS